MPTVTSAPTQQMRVVILAHVLDIPGEPLARPFTLGNDISQQLFGRPLRRIPEGDSLEFDAVHCPPRFDSDKDVKEYFMFDFGVVSKIDRESLESVHHQLYLAHRSGDTWYD